MANITLIGIIDNVKYLPNNNGCFIFISEFRRGYRKSDGERVEDKYLSWKCIFKQGLVKYISSHFSNGMVVEVKGEVLPYAIERDQVVDGYSVIGQTVNMFSIPRPYHREEVRMIKETMDAADGEPNLQDYNRPDF